MIASTSVEAPDMKNLIERRRPEYNTGSRHGRHSRRRSRRLS
jgi:hypothetical protein